MNVLKSNYKIHDPRIVYLDIALIKYRCSNCHFYSRIPPVALIELIAKPFGCMSYPSPLATSVADN